MYVFIVGMSIYSQVMCMIDGDILGCDVIAYSAAHYLFCVCGVIAHACMCGGCRYNGCAANADMI